MYSPKFRKWLFNYLEQPGVKSATGKKKAEMLFEMLNNCNSCDNEADFADIKLISDHVSIKGLPSARSIVARSSDLKKDLGVQATKRKTGGKAASKKTRSQRKATVDSNDGRVPLEYRVVSARDANKLVIDVNTMLETGEWYLAGGVSVMTVTNVGSLYTQALYRY
jgi:hypothetical protein